MKGVYKEKERKKKTQERMRDSIEGRRGTGMDSEGKRRGKGTYGEVESGKTWKRNERTKERTALRIFRKTMPKGRKKTA